MLFLTETPMLVHFFFFYIFHLFHVNKNFNDPYNRACHVKPSVLPLWSRILKYWGKNHTKFKLSIRLEESEDILSGSVILDTSYTVSYYLRPQSEHRLNRHINMTNSVYSWTTPKTLRQSNKNMNTHSPDLKIYCLSKDGMSLEYSSHNMIK